MADFVEQIKKIVYTVTNQMKPMRYVEGKVISINPLKIKLSDKIILTKEFLKCCESVKGTYKCSDGSTCTHEFKKGDTLVMIQQHGGLEYLILDKVVKL